MREQKNVRWFVAVTMAMLCLVGWAGTSFAETDVTAKVQVVKGTLAYDRVAKQSYLDVSLKNISQDVLLTPVKVVITSISTTAVTVANTDGQINGKPYFLYSNEAGALLIGETTANKRWLFANPKAVKFTYIVMVLGTVSTPEVAIEKATTSLNANDAPAFVTTVPSYEQESMANKLGQLGSAAPDVLQTLSGIIGNATVIEETATYRKMRGSINLPDNTSQEVFFDMVLENGIWKLGGV